MIKGLDLKAARFVSKTGYITGSTGELQSSITRRCHDSEYIGIGYWEQISKAQAYIFQDDRGKWHVYFLSYGLCFKLTYF